MEKSKLVIVIGILCVLFLLYVYKEIAKLSGKEKKVKDKKEQNDLSFIEKAKAASIQSQKQVELVENKEHRANLFQSNYFRKNTIEKSTESLEIPSQGIETQVEKKTVKQDKHINETDENISFDALKASVIERLNAIQARRKELMTTNVV